ncbi:MAG: M23 family metallopeptidase [Defluviitaleaceae bacterium]|nr:M23 family metallopeptidase [Defluviitaleaceae bacterium]
MLKKVIISAFAMCMIYAITTEQPANAAEPPNSLAAEVAELRSLASTITPQISNLHAREIATEFLGGTAISSQFLSDSNPPMFAVEMQTEDGAKYTLYVDAISATVAKMTIDAPPQVVPQAAPQAAPQPAPQAPPQPAAQETTFIWPVPGHYRISSGYGNRRNPFTGGTEFHRGIDIPAPTGTAVVAARSGWVTLSRWNGSGGYMVVISHGDGFISRYAHNSVLLVSAGQWVNQGDTIAQVGSTGMSTGPHLHFDMTLNGQHVSPLEQLGR